MPFGFHLPSPKSQTRPPSQQISEEGARSSCSIDSVHTKSENHEIIFDTSKLGQIIKTPLTLPNQQQPNNIIVNGQQPLENNISQEPAKQQLQMPLNTPKKDNLPTLSKTPQLIPSSLGKRKQSLNTGKSQVILNNFLPEDDKDDKRTGTPSGKMQKLILDQEEEYNILKPNKYEDYLEQKRKRTQSSDNNEKMLSTPSSSTNSLDNEDDNDDDDLLASVSKVAASTPISQTSSLSSKTPSSTKSPGIIFNIPKKIGNNSSALSNQPQQQEQNR
ncbi:hypothetical protein C9374_007195 [Naegleria lovaniensis]|uniref:Uncharacterized protein n=1 Tax=Naegleria lovaniensis TaxID=51637 RepID=A0AA88H500_NAELO|nr:uncharacterized protein C9374_007195 [Naegleria lovaniensis]KAG2393664.1 hypothetical protein C9374_007195 [Naegleria lovaniensis]